MSMRKVTIEHVIRSRDDERELLNQLKYSDVRIMLWDYSQWLRSAVKYNAENLSEEALNGIDKAREAFYQLLTENNISLDD